MSNRVQEDAQENAQNRNNLYAAFFTTLIPSAIFVNAASNAQASSLEAAMAGAATGAVAYFGLKYIFGVSAALDKREPERQEIYKKLRRFGALEGISLAAHMSLGVAACSLINGVTRHDEPVYERHLVSEDSDPIPEETSPEVREAFCQGKTSGKIIIHNIDGAPVSLDCGLK